MLNSTHVTTDFPKDLLAVHREIITAAGCTSLRKSKWSPRDWNWLDDTSITTTVATVPLPKLFPRIQDCRRDPYLELCVSTRESYVVFHAESLVARGRSQERLVIPSTHGFGTWRLWQALHAYNMGWTNAPAALDSTGTPMPSISARCGEQAGRHVHILGDSSSASAVPEAIRHALLEAGVSEVQIDGRTATALVEIGNLGTRGAPPPHVRFSTAGWYEDTVVCFPGGEKYPDITWAPSTGSLWPGWEALKALACGKSYPPEFTLPPPPPPPPVQTYWQGDSSYDPDTYPNGLGNY